jgi:hypothetical protein
MATDDDVRRVLNEQRDRLMLLPNVVGVGIASADITDPRSGALVAVYVRSKVPETQLAASDVVPATLEATLDGAPIKVPTRVIEVGDIRR